MRRAQFPFRDVAILSAWIDRQTLRLIIWIADVVGYGCEPFERGQSVIEAAVERGMPIQECAALCAETINDVPKIRRLHCSTAKPRFSSHDSTAAIPVAPADAVTGGTDHQRQRATATTQLPSEARFHERRTGEHLRRQMRECAKNVTALIVKAFGVWYLQRNRFEHRDLHRSFRLARDGIRAGAQRLQGVAAGRKAGH